MDIGRQLIAKVLDEPGALKRFIDAGFDMDWLSDKRICPVPPSSATPISSAYRFILRHWEKTGEPPSREYFEHSYPPQSCKPAETRRQASTSW